VAEWCTEGIWGQKDSARVLGYEETTRSGLWGACLLTCAKKAFSQYSRSVRTRAIRSGATVLIAEEINTVHKTGMRFTKMPVEILVRAPAMRDGRTRSDAPRAEVPWTC
jgi:hypothetical protein